MSDTYSELASKLMPWSVLESDAKAILETTLNEWLELVKNPETTEPKIHTFLANHAGMFLQDYARERLCISKLKLGGYETDFVTAYEEGSLGFIYDLIEIESPNDPIYTKDGAPSTQLNKALQQVRDWRQFVEENLGTVNKILPYTGGVGKGRNFFRYTVIIGTRAANEKFQPKIIALSKETGVKIRSFDALTDRFKEHRYPIFPIYSSSEMDALDPIKKNLIANPFQTALSDSEWRKIVSDGRFKPGHSFAKCTDLFLEQMRENEKAKLFQAHLAGLNDSGKAEIKALVEKQLKAFRM